ncbi:MAG: hypothetical protein KGL10_09000 [Alphaproteobacteria bacterium]|nr:hypothetical protein [Alphaproteobacteria bacterium]
MPDASGKTQLVEVPLDQARITRPTVVYLSGFLTNNNRPGYVAGRIKSMEELLQEAFPQNLPQIYGWSHTSLRNLFNLAFYNSRPSQRSSDAGFDIGAAVLMPLVAKDFSRDAKGRVSGAPLPIEEAKKNLRNVTIFGYSAGAIVAQETYNATLRMMKDIGYAEKDARGLLSEVVLVAAGVFSRYTKEKGRFTTLYLVASNDRMMRAKNLIWGTLGTVYNKLARRKKDGKELVIRSLSATSAMVSAPVRPTYYQWQYDENGKRKEKKYFRPLYPKWTHRRSYHELAHYITRDENNNAFANTACYALVNALNRKSRPAPLDLLQPPRGMAATDAYKAKIAAAVRRGNDPRP